MVTNILMPPLHFIDAKNDFPLSKLFKSTILLLPLLQMFQFGFKHSPRQRGLVTQLEVVRKQDLTVRQGHLASSPAEW